LNIQSNIKASPPRKSLPKETYAKAGVNISLKTKAIDRIRHIVGTTQGPEVLSGVGFYGGMYEFNSNDGSILVSSVDGVGTKIKIAQAIDKHDTIGIDIVNHCVNDILCCGARPLFFLDYIGIGKVVPERLEAIAEGLSCACREAGCALIGGEVAEMPGVYSGDDYDLVGFIIGQVDKNKIIVGKDITAGDVVLGLPSSGLHTNGYTLVRKVLDDTQKALKVYYPSLGRTLGEELLEPHRSYYHQVSPVLPLLKGIAHITGGGVIGNIPRILPRGLAVNIDSSKWVIPPIFDLLQQRGNIDTREMYRVFNMGLGMILICAPDKTNKLVKNISGARIVGEVVRQKSLAKVLIDGIGYRSDKVRTATTKSKQSS
jgi:phosphoribosylformylglycinamidine cyclo-ligase